MSNNSTTIDRRRLSLHKNKVREVLPEHFVAQYPDLIIFLEKYYDFLDSDQTINFDRQIKDLFLSRDLHSTSMDNLNRILKEIGLGLANTNYFIDPVFSSRLLSIFHRVKGSLYSAEAFFKAFYGIDAEISYPKRNIFIVGESQIGAESLRFIQDGALYQIYSILVKSELPSSVWREFFKEFAHPGGFYLGSEVVLVGVADNLATIANDMPFVIADPNFGTYTYEDIAIGNIAGDIDLSEIIASDSAGVFIRHSPYHSMQPYSSITIGQMDDMYQSAKDVITIALFTFDEDSDANGNAMDMSNSIQTFDQIKYMWYDSDSA
jgi:hypothetical protein